MDKLAKLLEHLKVVIAEEQAMGNQLSPSQLENSVWFSTMAQRRRAFRRAISVEPRLTQEETEGLWMVYPPLSGEERT